MPRIEIHLPENALQAIQAKADAAGQSRKKYIESLVLKNADEPVWPPSYPDPVPYNNGIVQPEPGQYVRHGNGYVFNLDGNTYYVSDLIFTLDNFQFHFTGEAGSVDDAILL